MIEKAKYRIYREARAAVVNRADEAAAEHARGIDKVITFGLDAPDDGQYGLRIDDGRAVLARGDTLLILISSQPNRLLETIRSRCQPLPFARHPDSRIQAELEKQLGLDATEAHILAALSEGSFKKAFGKDRELFVEERRALLKTLTGLSPGSILGRGWRAILLRNRSPVPTTRRKAKRPSSPIIAMPDESGAR